MNRIVIFLLALVPALCFSQQRLTLDQVQQVATAQFLGRNSGGTGDIEQLSTSTAKTLLNLTGTNSGDVTLSGENYLSLAGQVITANAVNLSGTNVTGTLAAARFGTLTGDVTSAGGSYATTIAAGVVSNSKLANMATQTFKGRTTAGTGSPEDLTISQAKTLLNLTGTNSGDVTLSGENYLSLAGQVITANAVNLSGTNVTGTLAAARFGALTGDVTSAGGSYATTLATVNSNVGTFGSGTTIPIVTVDGKGRITAVSTATHSLDNASDVVITSPANNDILKFNGTNWVNSAAAGGSGDIINGGNTTGATVVIGTNDAQTLALETNGTNKVTIASSGLFSHLYPGSTGSALTEVLRIENTPTTNGGSGGGSRINLRMEDDIDVMQDFVHLDSYWGSVDGSGGLNRANFRVQVHRNGSMVDAMLLDGQSLTIGNSPTALYQNTQIFTTAAFTIAGSTNQVQVGATNNDLKVNPSATASAIVEITASSKGVLFPNNTASGIASVSSPAARLMMYQNDGRVGLRHYVNSTWCPIDKGVTIAPTAITANQTNYTPSNFAESSQIKLSSNANIWQIQGLAYSGPSTPNAEDRKTLINNGGTTIQFPAGHVSATAAYRFDHPTDYFLLPGRSVDIRYDGTLNRWKFIDNSTNLMTASISQGSYYNWNSSSGTNGEMGSLETAVSGGTAAVGAVTSTLPAGLNLGTGSSSTGAASAYFGRGAGDIAKVGGGVIWLRLNVIFPTLSTGTQTYTFSTDILDSGTDQSLTQLNSLGIKYSNGINSGKFQAYTRNSVGTETTADLGVTVTANTEYELIATIDMATSEARFFVNGTPSGRITANLPTSGTLVGCRSLMLKSVGTTAISYRITRFEAGYIRP